MKPVRHIEVVVPLAGRPDKRLVIQADDLSMAILAAVAQLQEGEVPHSNRPPHAGWLTAYVVRYCPHPPGHASHVTKNPWTSEQEPIPVQGCPDSRVFRCAARAPADAVDRLATERAGKPFTIISVD